MTITIAKNVGPAHLDIAYERLGDPGAPPVLLIMGLGMQLVAWPDELCGELVRRNLHVIRFDNRDAGQSTAMTGIPNFAAAFAGDLSTAVYTLSDMAADTAGLLDVLGLDRVHVVGVSMGGFIGQTLAIEHPDRVRTLTSIMSSTGDRTVGQPHPETMQVFTLPAPTTPDEAADRSVKATAIIGSPGFPPDVEGIRDRARRAFARRNDPTAFMRQGTAVIASGDRTPRLRSLAVPTLVIHGAADRFVDTSGGRATAAAIPGARLVEIEGMGHDLPRPLWPQLAELIAGHVHTFA